MNKSIFVRLLGYRATFLHGDFLVYDRWCWLKKRLPKTRNEESLIDIGCGSGAFTIAAALRGYTSIGLSWDKRNQDIAAHRAKLCKAQTDFPIVDVRFLHEKTEFVGRFDVAICFENIEHIQDDRKLMRDMYACLRPGGMLLLSTPSYFYRAITAKDYGPFSKTEDGWHVRRGYTKAMLQELCEQSGFMVEEISSCGGFFSQKGTTLMRSLCDLSFPLGWLLTLPLRVLPPIFDRFMAWATHWPNYTICLVAYKPRYQDGEKNPPERC